MGSHTIGAACKQRKNQHSFFVCFRVASKHAVWNDCAGQTVRMSQSQFTLVQVVASFSFLQERDFLDTTARGKDI